jgi:hypothetical protein
MTSGAISPIISQVFYRCHNRFIRSDWRVEICANKLAPLSGNASLGNTTLVSFYFICYILFDSPDDSTGYRGDSTGDLQVDLLFRFPHKV